MPDDDDQAARRLPYTLTAALVGGSYLAIAHSTMTKPPGWYCLPRDRRLSAFPARLARHAHGRQKPPGAARSSAMLRGHTARTASQCPPPAASALQSAPGDACECGPSAPRRPLGREIARTDRRV